MIHKRANLILVAGASWFLLLAPPSICFALPVDMGTAGSQYWTVLQTGSGTVSLTQPTSTTSGKKSGKKGKHSVAAAVPTSHTAISGNVGVGQAGQILDSGQQFDGDVYLGDNTSAQFSGTYTNNSPVNGTVRMGNGSTLSPNTGYLFNDSHTALQPTLDKVRLDAMNASAAALALTATSTLSQISLGSSAGGKKTKGAVMSLTLDPGVYNLTALQLTRATLTLSGSGSFVFNISSSFTLTSSQILLANGATASNVLFNYTGTSAVNISAASGKKKAGSSSVLNGIILAMNANVNLAQGLVVGEIISGHNITVGGTSLIQSAFPNSALPLLSELPPTQGVPDETSTIALSVLALAFFVACRRLIGCHSLGLGRTRRLVGV